MFVASRVVSSPAGDLVARWYGSVRFTSDFYDADARTVLSHVIRARHRAARRASSDHPGAPDARLVS